jgi:hypothetical protein
VVILVSYITSDDAKLAKTQVEGRIGSEFFGGSIDKAITKAGEDIVEFTIRQFGPRS